jgi:hypothetical protein
MITYKKTILTIIFVLIAGFALGTIWSDYGDFSGDLQDTDTLLVRDISDTSLDVDGTQKELPFSVLKTNLDNFSTLEIPNDTSTDGVLANQGETHMRGDEDRISYHFGASGEISGEATKSYLDIISINIDPGSHYDVDTQVFLFEVFSKVWPNGITIDYWEVNCNVDPDVEMDMDLKRATDWIGLGSAALMDVLDTTNGVSSEDTDASINTGAVVAAGQVLYLEFGADPEGTCVQMNFTMIFHGEED